MVTDTRGGAIAGASVTVLDVGRGIPGVVTRFKTFDRQDVTVGVGGDIAVDVTLRPGAQDQTVTMTGAGKEPDIPYQPWGLAKTLSEFPPTGPDTQYDKTTDPYIKYCEPLGIGRVYMYPARTRFVHTPDAVYILHEQGEQFRVVRLNSKHPDDPDPVLGRFDWLV